MIIGIDATNIRSGGGVTHLIELLRILDPEKYGFKKIYVWSGRETLGKITDRPWLVKDYKAIFDKNLLFRAYWQRFVLSRLARKYSCDVLFIPGGSYVGWFHPFVALSQNLLPFESSEAKRYGYSLKALRLLLLRISQASSFRRAEGMIFLTEYASNVIKSAIGYHAGLSSIISHGIDSRFFIAPRRQMELDVYTFMKPIKILYVSIIDMYKHQWHVVKALSILRTKGIPISGDFIGPACMPAFRRFANMINDVDPRKEYINYFGPIPHYELHKYYSRADIFVFASSCENLPIILLEAMASGLPIACSDRGPMPEVLGDAGVYFNPEDPESIANSLCQLILSKELRETKALAAFEKSKCYSWERCARQTLLLLNDVVNINRNI